jgi:hypothetical protein
VTLRRRDFLARSGLVGPSAAVSACGSGVLKEPDVTRAAFGTDAEGTVTMWCRGAIAAGVQVAVNRFQAAQDRLHIELG